MMRGKKGRTNVCSREVHARMMRGKRGGQKSAVERAHVRRMRGKKGRTNVCSREGACENDEGEEGEDKCLRQRGCMLEGRREEEGRTEVCS